MPCTPTMIHNNTYKGFEGWEGLGSGLFVAMMVYVSVFVEITFMYRSYLHDQLIGTVVAQTCLVMKGIEGESIDGQEARFHCRLHLNMLVHAPRH